MTTTLDRSAPRSRKGDKRERTRAALIEAAAAEIRENGYDRVTLKAVAARVGMTIGAIYGNFKNREDLLVAVALSRWRPIMPPIQPGVSLRAYMRVIGGAVAEAAKARRPDAVLAAAYRTYVLGHEDMRAEAVRRSLEIQKPAAEGLSRAFANEPLPMPADQLVRVIGVLTDGFLFAYFQSPDQITEELIVAAFEALAT